MLFLVTFVTSIPAPALFQPVLDDPAGYIAGGGSDTRIWPFLLGPGFIVGLGNGLILGDLTVKGFRPSPALDEYVAATRRHTTPRELATQPG